MNNTLTNFKLIIKHFILNIKYIFSNPFSLFALIFFMLIGSLLPTVLFPFFVIGGIQVIFSVSIPLLIILGAVSHNWRNSTFMKNENLTNSSDVIYWMSIILVIFIVGNIQQLSMELMNYLFSILDILLDNWAFISTAHVPFLKYDNINAINYIYAMEINLVIVFSVFFMINSFFSNVKNYYIFILGLMILAIIFGGGLSEMFTTSQWKSTYGEHEIFENYRLTNPVFHPAMFPKQIFIPILAISPFYSSSEFYLHTITWGISGHNAAPFESATSTVQHFMTASYASSQLPFLLTFTSETWQWSLMMIMPYFWLSLSLTTGILKAKFSKKV